MLIAKLLVVGGEVKTTEIKLRLPCIIGRGKGATVTLPHPLVSRQHCELFEANGRLWVRDLGSLNGTYVNNEKVTETELPPNELLTIGAVTFRAVYDVHGDSGSENPPTARIPTENHGSPHESKPTVKVDVRKHPVAPVQADDLEQQAGKGPFDFHDDEDDASPMPSTPLFSVEAIPAPRPMSQPPAAIVPTHAVPAPVAIPQAVAPPFMPATATPVASTPAVPKPAANTPGDSGLLEFAADDSLDDKAEPEIAASDDDDDDLNDFLNNLGKK